MQQLPLKGLASALCILLFLEMQIHHLNRLCNSRLESPSSVCKGKFGDNLVWANDDGLQLVMMMR